MPRTGHFILHSNVVPTLVAGHYELVTEHTGTPFDVAPETTHVVVSAPRFVMPTDQILSTFPPANAEGAFGDRLPQIVLKRRTLPWERNPEGVLEPSTKPWLALVVVAEGEAELSAATPIEQCVTGGTTLLDIDEDRDVEQGLYLAVTQTVVRKVFPCEEDLELLAHVREVDVNDTELANGDDDGWLAVVLANRLPVFDKANDRSVRYMACLVNLEGQLGALPPPEPPVNDFTWELAQDWSVLATLDQGIGPDTRVMGGMDLEDIVLPQAEIPLSGRSGTSSRDARRGSSTTTSQRSGGPAEKAGRQGTKGAKEDARSSPRPNVPTAPSAASPHVPTSPSAASPHVPTSPSEAQPSGSPSAARLQAQRSGASPQSRISSPAGVPLDGGAAMSAAPVAGQWASVTEQIATAARDPDATRLVRDTMASGFRYPIELVAVEKVYRFPVLAHWSFTTNEGATFETLMQDIDVGLLGTVVEPEADAPPAPPGPEVVETGHIGLDHRTRRGDPVRAWYRGPLVPFPTLRDWTGGGLPVLAHSADQLRRVVPDGREDLALSAAFEIGRLLSLSQLSVVSALLRFRGEQFGAGRIRELISRVIDVGVPELIDRRIDLGRWVALKTIGEMVKNPEDIFGPRRPVADPGREIAVKGELDAVIAEGLGFDLDAIRKTGDRIGMLAAVTQAQVPIASPKGLTKFDKGMVAGLRDALNAELDHVLSVAAPVGKQIVGGAKGGVGGVIKRDARSARSGDGPDPLDALIERAESMADNDRSEEE